VSVVSHALAFARHGHAVFPAWWPRERSGRLICACRKGADCTSAAKHPYGPLAPHGLLSATTDAGLIRQWFGEAPLANLGVVTERLIVLDVDARHDGEESLRALEREHGELPATWRVLTGGGGEHVLFACPAEVEIPSSQARDNPVLGPGIDVRSRRGFIVSPPSRHVSGRVYAWSVDHHPADVPLAPPPGWLLARLAEHAVNEPHEAMPPEVWQRLTEPVRDYPDAAAAQVAGHLLRRWVDPYLVAGLLHAWNQTYVSPPLADDELRQILDRVARLEDQRRDAAQQQGGKRAEA
jgi:Bifunctional DNA primase/polymerase, N-terminal/Primase C terminal 1 (PriCT-1)